MSRDQVVGPSPRARHPGPLSAPGIADRASVERSPTVHDAFHRRLRPPAPISAMVAAAAGNTGRRRTGRRWRVDGGLTPGP
ncbi:MAG: hypothetical protein AVDCRST_MAG49-2907 [uncultured Thermomicrobiales bacterium]|uniref:Uncharacterized protein n=1 Tax=uncultured Thermomicrobiales bacterium TaxID=1645740 RepID=A0A6J4UTG9_9BACT|nr:MAG: hypothetical protein AVDCRST_MAG49-2907 [uncultured Thermomicrobiales bacterium]